MHENALFCVVSSEFCKTILQNESGLFEAIGFLSVWTLTPRVQSARPYACNVETLMKHYVALDEQQVTDDVFAQMAKKKT